MRIKKDEKTKNEYILADGVWVRNYDKYGTKPLSITKLIDKSDYQPLLKNETKNRAKNLRKIDEENIFFPKIIIVSDGYDFEQKHKMLKNVPKDVAIFAVNGSLAKWKLFTEDEKRFINFYIINNPYSDAVRYLPKRHRYYPSCLTSIRTNYEFVERYSGNIYTYEPVQEDGFGKSSNAKYCIDDYRNPICAAIGAAYRFGVQKLMLFCCDDSFQEQRAGAIQLENKLWTYPQQQVSHNIIDANLYWLRQQEDVDINVADFSSGAKYTNAAYIKNEEEFIDFFKEVNN